MSNSDEELKVVLGGDATQLEAATEAGTTATEEFAAASSAAMGEAAEAAAGYSEEITASLGHASEAATEHSSIIVRGMESITESVGGIRAKLGVFGEFATEISELVLVGFGLEKVVDFMKEFGEAGEEISHTAAIMDMTVAATSRLENAAEIAGVKVDGMVRSVNKLNVELNQVGGPSKQVQGALDELGITLDEIKGKTPDDQLAMLSDAFVKLKDEGVNPTSIGLELFGQRVGAQMIPFLLRGSEGVRELEEESDKLGGTWNNEMAEAAEHVAEGFNKASVASSGMSHRLAEELAPATVGLTSVWVDLVREGGAVSTILEALAMAVKFLAEIVVASITGFVELWEIVKFGVTVLAQGAAAAIEIGHALSNMDLAGAKRAWSDYTVAVGEDYKKMVSSITGEDDDLAAMLNKPKPKPEAVDKPATSAVGNVGFDANNTKNVEDWQKGLDQMLAAKQLFGQQAKAAEAEYWQGILSVLQAGTADYAAVQHKLYEVQAEEHRKAEADANRSAKASEAARKREVEADIKQEELEIKARAAARKQDEQIDDIAASSYAAHVEAMTKLSEKGIEDQAKNGQLSKKQEVAELADLENQRYALLMAELKKEEELRAGEPVKVAQINAQIERLQDQHAANLQAINEKLVDTSFQQSFKSMVTSMTNSWSSGITKMLQGTTSFTNFAKSEWNNMVSAGISAITKLVVAHVLGENTKTASTAMAETERLAIKAWSSIQSIAISVEEGIKEIAINAYKAMAGAYAAIAAIPYVGPFLAPAAAVAAGAAVFEIGSSVASAAGGYDIPAGVNPLTQLHQREMVLPAPIADTVRNAMNNGGAGGGGNQSFHYHAGANESPRSVMNNSSAFVAMGRKAVRSFAVRK